MSVVSLRDYSTSRTPRPDRQTSVIGSSVLDKLDSNGTIAVCVDPKDVGKVWTRVDHFIREAIDATGESNFDDVVDDVLHGASLLWLVWDGRNIVGAGITELAGDVCTLLAFGGRISDIGLIETIENFAQDEGCTKLRIMGRRGWTRVLAKRDYRECYAVLEKELNVNV